jgi:hypothetical protein
MNPYDTTAIDLEIKSLIPHNQKLLEIFTQTFVYVFASVTNLNNILLYQNYIISVVQNLCSTLLV